jgi:hypothetical protein
MKRTACRLPNGETVSVRPSAALVKAVDLKERDEIEIDVIAARQLSVAQARA